MQKEIFDEINCSVVITKDGSEDKGLWTSWSIEHKQSMENDLEMEMRVGYQFWDQQSGEIDITGW